MVVLARLLTPHDFGLIAMVTVITGLIIMVSELGIGTAIVQRKNITNIQLSSLFWINIFISLIVFLFLILLAPLIAEFYEQEVLNKATLIVSLSVLVSPFVMVQKSLLQRNMNFKVISIANTLSRVATGLLVIGMAYHGYGFWSLAWQPILSVSVTSIFLWKHSVWRPSFSFSFAAVAPMLGFGIVTLYNTILDYSVRGVDKMLIGKFFGADTLGVYSRSYYIYLIGINGFSRIFSSIMLPALSNIQDKKTLVKASFLKSTKLMVTAMFPLIIGLSASADNFILVLFGSKWLGMVDMLHALTIIAVATTAGSLVGSLYISQGNVKLQFKVALISKLFIIMSMLIGLSWGALGVAYGAGIATVITNYPMVRFAGRSIDMRYREYIAVIASPLLISIIMGVLVLLLHMYSPVYIDPIFRLILQIFIGALSYILMTFYFDPDVCSEILNVIKRKK